MRLLGPIAIEPERAPGTHDGIDVSLELRGRTDATHRYAGDDDIRACSMIPDKPRRALESRRTIRVTMIARSDIRIERNVNKR
jgi:hypothetical protein